MVSSTPAAHDDDDKDDTCPLLDLLQTDLFVKEILERLDPIDRTMLAQVGRPWLAAVLASGLPRLPNSLNSAFPRRLRLADYCTSGERLAWAKANGCSWGGETLRGSGSGNGRFKNPCALAAGGGHLEALQWARAHGCPWDSGSCARAAVGGHLQVLRWAREQGCPWNATTCREAAERGHLAVLQWAREQVPPCPWDASTCSAAARGGHLVGWCSLTLSNPCRKRLELTNPFDTKICRFAFNFCLQIQLAPLQPGGAAMGADALLPVGRRDVPLGRRGWTPGGVKMGAWAALPLGLGHVLRGRWVGAPGGVEVGAE